MKKSICFNLLIMPLVIHHLFVDTAYTQDTPAPPAVQNASMVSDGQFLYLFGGLSDTTLSPNRFMKTCAPVPTNDVCVFDPNTHQWKKEDALSSLPKARTYQSLINAMPNNHQFILYGGVLQGEILSDAWIYDAIQKNWDELVPEGTNPPDRAVGAITESANGFLLSGGKDAQGNAVRDIWEFNMSNKTWNPKMTIPETIELDGHGALRISNSLIVMLGGSNYNSGRNVWLYDETLNTLLAQECTGAEVNLKRGGFINPAVFQFGLRVNFKTSSAHDADGSPKIYLGGGIIDYNERRVF